MSLINLSIDYEKLKEALKADPTIIKTTEKGKKFLNLTVSESKEIKFGNTHMVTISTTKEERAAGKKGAILGNGKLFEFNKPNGGYQANQQPAPEPIQKFNPNGTSTFNSAPDISDLPF